VVSKATVKVMKLYRLLHVDSGSCRNAKEQHADQTIVSQFTLLASMKKGNKPDFHQSASGDKARTLYETFFKKVGALYEPDKVKDGLFAAMMDVALVNDGPVCHTSSTAMYSSSVTSLSTCPVSL
jgi:D-tyrosyl-tRNA(Tyr) deacylase